MRAPALGPEQARQDALAIASMRAEMGVDADEPEEIAATEKSIVEATA
jgi:glycerol-3-phosphate dehydrogenase